MLISAIIKLVIGWLFLDKVPSIVEAKGTLRTIIKLIGLIIIIAGAIDLVRYLL